jgi:two-component system LytT family sensor kinase
MFLRDGSAPIESAVVEREPADAAADPAAGYWMGRRALLLNFAFWTLFGALTASNWLLSPIVHQYPDPGPLIAKALFTSYLWALLTPGIFWLATRFNPEHGPRVRRALLLLAVALGVALLVAFVQAFVAPRLLPMATTGEAADEWELVWGLTRRYFPTAVVTFLVVLGAGIGADIFRRYRARQREADQLQAQASQLQAERAELRARTARLQAQSAELHAQLSEARLAMLRTQLNPHFLFNTLNAVSALVARDPRGVRDMIALLSELLRYALKESREQEIPLHEELRLLRLYLEILEIRYQGQLRTIVSVDPEAHEALVPNLILQPLVENAMKHGIDRAGGHGLIEVRARRSGDDLILIVQDSGPGSDTREQRHGGDGGGGGGGVGLRLTRERLAELYGSESRLELDPVADGGMVAQLVVPYHTRQDVRLAEEFAP